MRTLASVAFVSLVALTACGKPVQPQPVPVPVPTTDQTPASYEKLVGEWHSTMTDSLHLEGIMLEQPMPSGEWDFRFRARCSGTGTLSFSVRGKAFNQWGKVPQCTGKWLLDSNFFPPFRHDDNPHEGGPYTVIFDAEATVTSWDVEAYATQLGNRPSRTPSPSPST
ncbi:hypothetical protein ABZS66_05235 [Dactylosporangium sp. NPDC005572]|uniref:hypothetical protein n=1 Tax=Dactylosporangium sp. NPDC005572 TaxID=3156889 RepID=UPI0033A28D15